MRIQERSMTENQAWQTLKNRLVGRLGLYDEQQKEPYVVPVHYCVSDRCIYIHGAPQGRKMRILKSSPRVCFEVDECLGVQKAEDPCQFTTHYRSVIAHGKARIIKDDSEKRRVLGALISRFCPAEKSPEMSDAMVGKTAVVEITVDSITGKQNPSP